MCNLNLHLQNNIHSYRYWFRLENFVVLNAKQLVLYCEFKLSIYIFKLLIHAKTKAALAENARISHFRSISE